MPRFGHVQLSAWVSNTERAIITATDIAPTLALPAPPEGVNTAEPKGYQQITGWQVRNPASINAVGLLQTCTSALHSRERSSTHHA